MLSRSHHNPPQYKWYQARQKVLITAVINPLRSSVACIARPKLVTQNVELLRGALHLTSPVIHYPSFRMEGSEPIITPDDTALEQDSNRETGNGNWWETNQVNKRKLLKRC